MMVSLVPALLPSLPQSELSKCTGEGMQSVVNAMKEIKKGCDGWQLGVRGGAVVELEKTALCRRNVS